MQLHSALLGIGVLFLVALVADVLGRRTNIPRVTLLMLVGVLIGRSGLEMLPAELEYWYEFLAAAALTMVAFLLGGALSLEKLKRHGRKILTVSIAVVAASVGMVGGGLWLLGAPASMALLLAGITPADPARAHLSMGLMGLARKTSGWKTSLGQHTSERNLSPVLASVGSI
jgi:Kef-type K+ transport system membrane component KefB